MVKKRSSLELKKSYSSKSIVEQHYYFQIQLASSSTHQSTEEGQEVEWKSLSVIEK
jgi:hypothetical protein